MASNYSALESIGSFGTALGGAVNPYLGLVSLLAPMLGGLFDDSEEKQRAEQAKLEREKLDLQRKELEERKKVDARKLGFTGLGQLAADRSEATNLNRRYNFASALNKVASQGGV